MKKSKYAFNLSEILITLSIIGIIAALCTPSMIDIYNKKITEMRLKKFYSIFNQAIRLSIEENGEPEGWDDYIKTWGNNTNKTNNINSFDKYLRPYMKVSKVKEINGKLLYLLPDRSAFSYRTTIARDICYYPRNALKCIAQTEMAFVNFGLHFTQQTLETFGDFIIIKVWNHICSAGVVQKKIYMKARLIVVKHMDNTVLL